MVSNYNSTLNENEMHKFYFAGLANIYNQIECLEIYEVDNDNLEDKFV